MSYSVGTVARTCGAAIGVLLAVLFLADVARGLSGPDSAQSAPTHTAARR